MQLDDFGLINDNYTLNMAFMHTNLGLGPHYESQIKEIALI